MLDRREALAYLIADAVLGVGLLFSDQARSVGDKAGKLVWVGKGSPPIQKEIAAAKLAVQRTAAKRSITAAELAGEKQQCCANVALRHSLCPRQRGACRSQ